MGRFAATLAVLIVATAVPARSQLRDLSTDRPDKTESPYTVDAGHVQIELDFATYTTDRTADERTESVSITPFNLKYGLGRDTDIQVVIAPHQRQTITDRATGERNTIAGFGDVTIRLKHNLWGNDAGGTAFAIMPFITLPTAREGLGADDVEVGLIAPLSIKLTDHIDLGLMTQLNVTRDGATLITSATLGLTLTDRLGLYTELYTEVDPSAPPTLTADTGLTFALGATAQLDLGVNFGLSEPADDITLFAGFSKKF